MRRALSLLALLLALLITPAAATQNLDDWMDALAGAWAGPDNQTPAGRMPFALLFDWQEDGSLRAYMPLNRETFVDLRFHRDGDHWLLEESGGLAGMGHQAHTLVPAAAPGEVRRWVHPEDAELVTVDFGLTGASLLLKVLVRGEEHAVFQMQRLPEEQIPAMRSQIALLSQRDPGVGPSIFELGGVEDVPASILAAREAVAASPADAAVRMELAEALTEAIQENMMEMGPRFAGELLRTLTQAQAMDPAQPTPYYYLVGYYLNAPPMAGGSVEKAEEYALMLQEIDHEAGTALLATVSESRQVTPSGH